VHLLLLPPAEFQAHSKILTAKAKKDAPSRGIHSTKDDNNNNNNSNNNNNNNSDNNNNTTTTTNNGRPPRGNGKIG
jgi:hypothetical protein